MQFCTARYLGAFPEDLAETPAAVVAVLARQLGIESAAHLFEYRAGRQRSRHAIEIRLHCGYREFADSSVQFRLQSMAVRVVLDRHRSAKHESRTRSESL